MNFLSYCSNPSFGSSNWDKGNNSHYKSQQKSDRDLAKHTTSAAQRVFSRNVDLRENLLDKHSNWNGHQFEREERPRMREEMPRHNQAMQTDYQTVFRNQITILQEIILIGEEMKIQITTGLAIKN